MIKRIIAVFIAMVLAFSMITAFSGTTYAATEEAAIILGEQTAVPGSPSWGTVKTTVKGDLKTFSIAAEDSLMLTSVSGTGYTFRNAVISSTEADFSPVVNKAYKSVQLEATSGKAAETALNTIQYAVNGKTITVIGSAETVKEGDIYFNGHFYTFSSFGDKSWAQSLEWAFNLMTNDSTRYPGYKSYPIVVNSKDENQMLVNIWYNNGSTRRQIFLPAVPVSPAGGSISVSGTEGNRTVTVTGEPYASTVTKTALGHGEAWKWMDGTPNAGETLPNETGKVTDSANGYYWAADNPTDGGMVYFGHPTLGAVWDDLAVGGQWGSNVWSQTITSGTFYGHMYALAEWEPKNLSFIKSSTKTLNIEYKVHFDINGGTGGSMSDQKLIYDVSSNLTQNDFTKTGYSFNGWAKNAKAAVADYSDKASVKNLKTTNGDIQNLYAVWKPITYKVKFDGNKATSGSVSDQTLTYDSEASLTVNSYQRTGYLFLGWAKDPKATVADFSDEASVKNLKDTQDAVQTLYAVWKPITYTVRFDGNTSTSGTGKDQTMTYDSGANLTKNPFEKTGYYFSGWASNSKATIAYYSDECSVKNLKNTQDAIHTFYAIWKPIVYFISYDGNGATSGQMSEKALKYDSESQLSKNTFEKTGYLFEGWVKDSEAAVPDFTDEEAVKNLKDKEDEVQTLYALWKPITYTIKFDGNDATSGTVSDQTMTYDSEDVLNRNAFERIGHEFIGWAKDPKATVAEYADEEAVLNLKDTQDEIQTLYAVWKPITYNIVFETNGGIVTGTAPESYQYGTEVILPEITKLGSDFCGWYADELFSGEPVTKISATDIEDKEFFAKWEEIIYKITLKNEDYEEVIYYTYGATIIFPANLTKDLYIFDGWYSSQNGDESPVTQINDTDFGDKTLYAKWTPNIPEMEEELIEKKEVVVETIHKIVKNCDDEDAISVVFENLETQVDDVTLENPEELDEIQDETIYGINLIRERKNFYNDCVAFVSKIELDGNYLASTTAKLKEFLEPLHGMIQKCETDEDLDLVKEAWAKEVRGLMIYRLYDEKNVLFVPTGIKAYSQWLVSDISKDADIKGLRQFMKNDRYDLYAAYQLSVSDFEAFGEPDYHITLDVPDNFTRGTYHYVLVYEKSDGSFEKIKYTYDKDGTVSFIAPDFGNYYFVYRSNPSILWGLCILALLIIVGLIILAKRKKEKED